ncbi:MAG: GGDEF domain-containing protein [Lachnospiraceae bacterium]|nr:GGDEF domain-containing protein [Lachnospiraceae bacterium]
MSRIHKIAVFISHIYGDYQRNVCQGIIDRATQYGYHVDIFVSNDENILEKYATGESSILKIPNASTYDGAMVSAGTYLVPELREQIMSALENWDCPVIDINSVQSRFPSVLLDNNTPIMELVAHLAQDHGLQRISFLGNSVHWYISRARQSHYSNAMKELNLSKYIRFTQSDYSKEGISAALDELLTFDPQAIVCYNDDMAYTLLGELASRGIHVPEDIAVTGCDNLEYGQHLNPPLTGITFPAYELGEQAFFSLLDLLDVEIDAPTAASVVKSQIHYGGTCGCKGYKKTPSILFHNYLKGKTDSLESIFLKSNHMSASLQGLNDIDLAMEVLAGFVERLEEEQGIKGLSEFYLCLHSDWEQISSRVRQLTLLEETPEQDKIILKLAYKNHTLLPECTFSRNDSLPEFIRKTGSQVYVYTPLYFGTRSFGYLCEAFENNIISYTFSFVAWLQNVDSMLQTISDSRNMQLMLNRLEDLYQRDSLTGLLNLQSFKLDIPSFLERAQAAGSLPISIVLDLDRLKHINDVYGHAEGNFAIQVLGQAINQVCTEDTLACRFGGDEFYLMTFGISKDEAHEMILRIQNYLDHYNSSETKPYTISVSGGFAVAKDFTEEAMDDAFKVADKNMYLQKQTHRRSRE